MALDAHARRRRRRRRCRRPAAWNSGAACLMATPRSPVTGPWMARARRCRTRRCHGTPTRRLPRASTRRWPSCRSWTLCSTRLSARCAPAARRPRPPPWDLRRLGQGHASRPATGAPLAAGARAALRPPARRRRRPPANGGVGRLAQACPALAPQGRFSFYMTSAGEEATVVGSAAGLSPEDMVRPAAAHVLCVQPPGSCCRTSPNRGAGSQQIGRRSARFGHQAAVDAPTACLSSVQGGRGGRHTPTWEPAAQLLAPAVPGRSHAQLQRAAAPGLGAGVRAVPGTRRAAVERLQSG